MTTVLWKYFFITPAIVISCIVSVLLNLVSEIQLSIQWHLALVRYQTDINIDLL